MKWKLIIVASILIVLGVVFFVLPSVSATKGDHNYWGYVSYNTKAENNTNSVSTRIDRNELTFALDNKHITVEYKSDTFDWFIPCDNTISKDVYYRFVVDDNDTSYEVTVFFKNTSQTNDVRISCYPGADSTSHFSKDAVVGEFDKFWINALSGFKKAIINLWNW